MRLVYHPSVQRDMSESIRWYREIDSNLADEFWDEVQSNLVGISKNPEQYHFDQTGYRRCNLKRFPFNILFRELRDRIRIVVIRHDKRNPSYGTRRK